MPRYIDADALVKRLKHSPLFLGTNLQFKDGVIDLVEKQPAADVVPREEFDELKAMLEATIAGQETLQRAFAKEERCIACDEVIPEGRQVCPKCERRKADGLDKSD